ncbi:hypothetical protein RSOLAG1IB_10475 [Rhizoctonia solani AG-1 IB]|uniref:AIG1-type G domain-containing protein n=1 Tax=Thanatephorus cucumeris (strain AG1-IB / isolate 7/3/14) TaxID=1108050 RepID=A0A0B7G2R8_THACB|nr:hypothetical protein RSOLAG1IB_10475 [Rhizoctonia solani AG-1 IB]
MTETTIPDTINKAQHDPHLAGEVEPEIPSMYALDKKSPLKLPRKKKALTILLVGETGSGKTSFLSLLLNLLKGNGPFDLTEQHDTNTESGLDTTQSQTIGARLYPFTTAGGIEFQIIDTPGLADTRGMDENSKHKERIFSAVKELITRIDAVMLVINRRNERLSASTSYTLETLATLFPRSIENNIGIIFTNTDLYGGLNFNMNALPLGLRAAKSWRLENPLSKYKDYLGRMRELTEAQKKESPQARRLLEDYEGVVETLDNWFAWLDSQEAVPTKAIIDLYHKSNEIESRLFDTTLSLENLPRLRKALRDLVGDLEGVERSRTLLAEVRNKEPPKIWHSTETTNYNTICLARDCHKNCHTQCNLELGDPEYLGGWCKVFKTLGVPNRLIPLKSDASVTCSKCGHEASDHRNYQRLYELKQNEVYEAVVRNLQDTQLSIERLKEDKARLEREIETIEHDIEESRLKIPRMVEEMNGVSLSPNYAGYIRSAIGLFEHRKKQLESRADSDEDLWAVNKGLATFKAHLLLVKNAASSRVISASSEVVAYGKRAIGGGRKPSTMPARFSASLDGWEAQEFGSII